MNAFDLNRKEYIRVNNHSGGQLVDFTKVTFSSSFIITGINSLALPTAVDLDAIENANNGLIDLIADYCSDYFDWRMYACYISEMGVLNSDIDINVPYAKVNVYVMNGFDTTI
jgi:hypothetical protein